ncbi:DUF2062 domain-containing protein [Chryseobacterium salivictor]|uniref:DUF2062 domain-containing protein n=1 Tax=Chryseobacterium salivictor TaxID=2547600 RepID=A0A4P6ZDE2_9FLAO|nr:DUF2062 domain-containing protein [Chryseobacterium salivictor]QBO57533.1 hypothetical protein NBC122_00698 [Chryseobacterium salivictor]
MKKFIHNTIQSQKVFYRYFRKKGLKRFLKENVLESTGSNETKAKSIALGVFIGLSPFWGLHSFLAVTLSVYFKLNKLLTFMSAQVTFPPLIPLIIFLSMMAGGPFVSNTTSLENQSFDFEFIKNNLTQYIIGSFILSVGCAVILGFLSYFILERFNPQSKNDVKKT